MHSNGVQQARSVRHALDWVALQLRADVSRNVGIDQPHGGLTTLAYGTEPHPGIQLQTFANCRSRPGPSTSNVA